MKKILFTLCMSSLLFSCKNSETTDNPNMTGEMTMEQMQKVMKDESLRKDSTINSFMQSMNEIEENLTSIQAKQKIVLVNSKDVELQKTQPERIVEDIASINDLLEKNKKAIAGLSSKLKKANIKISELEKMIERMTRTIEEKDGEIVSLKEELEKKNVALKNLFSEYNERVQELGDQSKIMSTAYYAFGTMKELQKKGVITKEGGFIGIGKNKKLSDNFNKEYFTKIDINETVEITLSSKKAKLLTTHPTGAYKITGEGKADKLVILNPVDFWSVSKYLVIIVE